MDATLGNGFFSTPGRGFGQRHNGHGPPRLLAQIEIEFADGTRRTVATDETWKWTRSEITFNDVLAGLRGRPPPPYSITLRVMSTAFGGPWP